MVAQNPSTDDGRRILQPEQNVSPKIDEPSSGVPNKLSDSQNISISGMGSRESKTETKTRIYNGWHSTRNANQLSAETLQTFLLERGSPLAPYAQLLSESPYSGTIIGICTIEQYGCTKAPYNNFWGIKSKGRLQRFDSIPEAISAVSRLLAVYESKDKDSVESLNGFYVQPASPTWLATVLKTKETLESLN